MSAPSAYPPNLDSARCGSRQALNLIADRWVVLVVRALQDGPQRYEQLRRRIQGISKKMLTQTLRDLERNGLVDRIVRHPVPPNVEYRLTPLGDTLRAPLGALGDWAVDHLGEVEAARRRYDAAPGDRRYRAGTRPLRVVRSPQGPRVVACPFT